MQILIFRTGLVCALVYNFLISLRLLRFIRDVGLDHWILLSGAIAGSVVHAGARPPRGGANCIQHGYRETGTVGNV